MDVVSIWSKVVKMLNHSDVNINVTFLICLLLMGALQCVYSPFCPRSHVASLHTVLDVTRDDSAFNVCWEMGHHKKLSSF